MKKYEKMDLSRFYGHTPGPWKEYGMGVVGAKITYDDKEVFVPVFQTTWDFNEERGKKSLELALASPDLLAKLQEAQEKISDLEEHVAELEKQLAEATSWHHFDEENFFATKTSRMAGGLWAIEEGGKSVLFEDAGGNMLRFPLPLPQVKEEG